MYRNTNTELHTIREKLYLLSKKIIIKFSNILNQNNWKDILQLEEYIHLFVYYQKLYLSIDRQTKIQELLLRWYNEETELNLIKENTDIDEKSKIHIISFGQIQQNKTINILKLIDNNIDINFLSLYKDTLNNIRETYKQIYWNNISLIDIIIEMLEKLKILIPFKKRDIVYKDLDKKIDIEFIRCKIEGGVFDESELKNICDIFVKYLCSVCSSVMRESIVMKYKKIVESEYDKYEIRVKTYIKFILDQLNDVHENIEVIKFVLSKGINIFA
jgi:hypothetical protein